jgi:hypothetical protein
LEREFEENEVWGSKGFEWWQGFGSWWFLYGPFSKSTAKFWKMTFWQFLRSFIVDESLRWVLMQLLYPLFLKKVGVVDIKDSRPISLVGGVYKSISKVMANMLKSVLGKIISNSQNAFNRGRQILDLVLITN